MTNSPIHRPLTSGIFAAIPFVCVRRVLGNSFRRNAEYLAARVNAATLIRIARHVSSLRSLPSQLWFEHVGPGGMLPRCFPGLFPQSIQDSLAEVISVSFQSHKDIRDWQAQMHPVVLKVVGRRTRIRCAHQGPKPAFSLSNLLRSLVIHDPKSVMEKGENHGKFVGVFKNEYQYRVTNPEKQNSAGRSLPISG